MYVCKLGEVLSKVVLLKRITDEGLGAELPAAGGYGGLGAKPPPAWQFFCNFFGKTIAILMLLDHISHVFRAI